MPIKDGDTVQVHYTGTLDDGSVFDSSKDRDALEFVMGTGMLIAGFEAAVKGREVGETVTVHIQPADAYGEVDNDLVFSVPRSEMPEHINAEEGLQLQLSNDEEVMNVTITEVSDDEVVLDANHPLAGQALTFEIEIVAVK